MNCQPGRFAEFPLTIMRRKWVMMRALHDLKNLRPRTDVEQQLTAYVDGDDSRPRADPGPRIPYRPDWVALSIQSIAIHAMPEPLSQPSIGPVCSGW